MSHNITLNELKQNNALDFEKSLASDLNTTYIKELIAVIDLLNQKIYYEVYLNRKRVVREPNLLVAIIHYNKI